MDQGVIEQVVAGPRRVEVPVSGMTCAGCVRRVERAIAAVPGVSQVAVNLATGRASASVGAGFRLVSLTEALAASGYNAMEVTYDLAIEGMTCASCSGRVERALLAVPGVIAAEVNLATERARVRALAPVGSIQAAGLLESAVRQAGYNAHLIDPAVTKRNVGGLAPSRDGWLALLALIVASPLLAPMLLMPFGVDAALPAWSQLGLAAVLQFGFGARFYRSAWQALRAGTANMDSLVALGTSAAFGLSLWELVPGHGGALYFEASAAVIALVRCGKWLESGARRQAGEAIRALENLAPDRARVRRGGVEQDIAARDLRIGDVLVLRPGERIAADAVVREGEGSADECLLTGESLPVAKQPGSQLLGGALNGEAVLLAEVTATGAESQLARMVRLVEDAQAAKPPVQCLVDRVSAVFVPVVIVVAAVTFLGWWAAGLSIPVAVVNAVAVLVIACPCALGLATPAAIMVGTGVAARAGILLRDAAVLEQSRAIHTVVFDKTGTLTEGRPVLVGLHTAAGTDPEAALRLAAAVQAGSEHPLARALMTRAGPHDLLKANAIRALPGRGVQGEVGGHKVVFGNARLMAEAGIETSMLDDERMVLAKAGRTVSYLAEDDRVLAIFGFGDALKPGAAEAVAQLRGRGLRVVLLTGDNRGAAEAAAEQLGIEEVHAEALPADKAALIGELRAGGGVAMVGDGVNDAAALAAADLGMAMATGTDVATATAGITLMRGDPRLVPAALDIAARTDRCIRRGLFWAFIYNLVGIPLAASGVLSPVLAGAAMAFSSVSVVGSALLLRRWQPAMPPEVAKRPG